MLPGSCRSCSRRGREFYYLGHVRSRHRYRPSAQRWAAAGGMIPPRVSYSAACNFFRNYDVRFGKQRVDTCETCTSFEFQLAGNLSPEMRDQVHADFQAHLRASDESFKFRHDDHERCCNLRPGDPDGPGEENPTFSCADIDFAGGLRTPLVTVQSQCVILLVNYLLVVRECFLSHCCCWFTRTVIFTRELCMLARGLQVLLADNSCHDVHDCFSAVGHGVCLQRASRSAVPRRSAFFFVDVVEGGKAA